MAQRRPDDPGFRSPIRLALTLPPQMLFSLCSHQEQTGQQMARPAAVLAGLRARIAEIENRPLLAEQPASSLPSEDGAAEGEGLPEIPPGLLHEVFVDEVRQAGAGLGFALGLATGLLRPERHGIVYLQLAGAGQELGLPYAPGFGRFGIAPERVSLVRAGDLSELLWAMEEAIACPAVAVVIADIMGAPKLLDFISTRRLSLRAQGAGSSAFLLRYGTGREASAARLRWRVTTQLSGPRPWDAAAPGAPRFALDIEKQRLGDGQDASARSRLLLDWTDHGFLPVDLTRRVATRAVSRPSPSRPDPAALGHRLSQAG